MFLHVNFIVRAQLGHCCCRHSLFSPAYFRDTVSSLLYFTIWSLLQHISLSVKIVSDLPAIDHSWSLLTICSRVPVVCLTVFLTICPLPFVELTIFVSLLTVMSAHDRSLRYYKKQIEKLIYTVSETLEHHVDTEACILLETAEFELNQLRASYSEEVKKYLLQCSDQEFDEKCDSLTENQDALFESCRLVVAKSKNEIQKFRGMKARDSLAGVPSGHSTAVSPHDLSMSAKHYPKIKIPTFDGEYRQFMRFKGIFVNLVHDEPSIQNIRKLYYLQEALTGEAARLIEDLPMTDDAYEEAWSRVLSRYDNQKALVLIYFRELTSVRKIKDSSELRKLLDTVTNSVNNLKLCNLPADNWSDLVAYLVYQCLDDKTRDDFDNSQSDNTKYFGWKVLNTFLKGRAYCSETRSLAENATPQFTPVTTPAKPVNKSTPSEFKSSVLAVTRDKCIVCQENHLLIGCAAFASLTPQQRFDMVSQHRLCGNCFSKSHQVRNCDSRGSCKVCNQRHHTLLHFPKKSPTKTEQTKTPATATPVTVPETPKEKEVNPPPTTNVTHATVMSKTVLLPTAVVKVIINSEMVTTARVLLDSCSQVNLVSEDFVKKFKLPLQLKSTGHTSFTSATEGVTQVSHSCSMKLMSRVNGFSIAVVADVVPTSTLKYSTSGLSLPKDCQPIRGYPLADPAIAQDPVHVPVPDILLGAEYFETCILNDTRKFQALTLRNSQFGWVLTGPVTHPPCCNFLANPPLCATICQIEAQLRRFCEMEDIEEPFATDAEEQDACTAHFDQTHTYHSDGKFLVNLPLHSSTELLTFNFSYAYRNLMWTEKRRDDESEAQYIKFMREYDGMQHMTKVTTQNQLKVTYLIPHKSVSRPESTTTQTRVVFNASAKTLSGYSLNDILMIGPTIQPDLFTILLQFRQHRVAFTADITKMYRCIWVKESDRHLQCVLWREKPDQPVETYQLNTLTYGTACAPFIATKCLETLSKTIPEYPLAALAIKSHFYMDDLLSGAATVEECLKLQQRVHSTLAKAGFVLRKYQPNEPRVLATLSGELLGTTTKQNLIGEFVTSVLGVCWQAQSDSFQLKVACPSTLPSQFSRRSLLSEISKTFDPLGFATPFTIRAKVFMQRVWSESSTWDEPLPKPLADEFASYWSELRSLESFQVSRPYVPSGVGASSSQLIGFCDASEIAYCAVVYFRVVSEDGNVSVTFVCAKSRVAPLKQISIPRLELQAALLLTQLISRVAKILNMSSESIRVFSDSKVVLAWLAKPPAAWKMFVRNRVARIVKILEPKKWAFVKGSQNPADLGTRGISVAKFLESSRWLHGPTFLLTDNLPSFVVESTDLEKRNIEPSCALTLNFCNDFANVLNRYSSYTRLLRSFAFVLRFINNCKLKIRTRQLLDKKLFLSPGEIIEAETRLIRVAQMQAFRDVYVKLFQEQPLGKNDQLRALNPFLDSDQLLRVGGRLRQASLPYDHKHPVILPVRSRFVELLIRHIHGKFFHAQRALVVNHLRTKFWCHGNLSSAVKKCIRLCVTCVRYKSEATKQLMADLPVARVNPSRPFTNVGIDFAGPFTTKCVGHRSNIRYKSYIALFVCLSTRATHLEVVSSLSTDHFMLSFTRFIARRGRPALILSDNGTNFVGAAAILQLDDERVTNFSSENRIRWHFNPPRAPHRGGLWETCVKSMKKHLVRSTEGQIFTFEEFTTVTCKVEAVLNSRPLTVRIDDNQEHLVITPGHFLIGDSLLSDPIPDQMDWKLTKRFEIVQRTLAVVWKAWYRDYIAQLQTRWKWQTPAPNLQVGDLVILKDVCTAPCDWPLAKVSAVFPDSQGLVRTVEVLANGVRKRRDISVLVRVPVDEMVDAEAPTPGECQTQSSSSASTL